MADKMKGLVRLFRSTISSADDRLRIETNPKERERLMSIKRRAQESLNQLNQTEQGGQS